MPNTPTNFWDFSLDLYAREGVAAACLNLQDKFLLDVNLVLLCFWYGSCYGEIDEQLLADIVAFSREWRQQVVQPLRNTRSWMKQQTERSDQFNELRERIKANELDAEKYQQDGIAKLVRDAGCTASAEPDIDASIRNTEILLRLMAIDAKPEIDTGIRNISLALAR